MFEMQAVIFVLIPPGHESEQWTFRQVAFDDPGPEYGAQFLNLAIDAKDNLYATDLTQWLGCRQSGCARSADDWYIPTHIFKLDTRAREWQTLVTFNNVDFENIGALAVDKHGILYGVTMDCGTSNNGTVWKLKPNPKGRPW